MKILIADDELQSREHLAQLIKRLPGCTLLPAYAENGHDTLQRVAELNPDVLLLDINLSGLDGLQVAAQLCEQRDAPAIIFCTTRDDALFPAFEISSVAYVHKPISKEHLVRALAQAQRISSAQLVALSRAPATINRVRTHLNARTHKGIELIPVKEIIHCVADNKYITVRHRHGETLLDESLKSLHDEFTEQFVRIHRNALVSRTYIERLERTPSGHYVLHLRDTIEPLSVSRRHVATVRKLVNSL